MAAVASFEGAGADWIVEIHFAQAPDEAAVREGWVDCVGLGRMVLAYPKLPLDVIRGRELQRKRVCRTFSDCTTAPRAGLPSGCYPLDEHYRQSEEAVRLKDLKHRHKNRRELNFKD